MTRTLLRDMLVALSLANLLFVRVWADLFVKTEDLFYLAQPPAREAYWLPALAAVVLGASFLIMGRIVRSVTFLRGFGRVGLLGMLLLGLNGLRSLAPAFSIPLESLADPGLARGALGLVGVLIVAALLIAARSELLVLLAYRIALALFLLAPITLIRAVWDGAEIARGHWADAMRDRPSALAPARPSGSGARVLVMVFDELDESVVFSDRSEGLDLPALDRFRSEAIACENAYPPSFMTDVSVPAMLTGLDLGGTFPRGPGDLGLLPRGQAAVRWSRTPDVFSAVRAAGVDSGIAGWYLPYCRILGDRVTKCQWFPFAQPPRRLTPILIGILHRLVEVVPGALRTSFAGRLGLKPLRSAYDVAPSWHLAQLGRVRQAALDLALDPRIGFSYVHFPIPHEPFMFDRVSGRFSEDGKRSYEDNLALVDATLSELRSRMEATGVWERTAVIITGDHWWRRLAGRPAALVIKEGPVVGNRAHRVPLMIKPIGATRAGSAFMPVVRTTVLKDLVVELLSEGSHDAKRITEWLKGVDNTHRAGLSSVP